MRTFLRVYEAAFVLQASEMRVRRMLDVGTLKLVGEGIDVGRRRKVRIDPASVRAAFPADGRVELRRLALDRVLSGHLRVPRPASRWGQSAPLDVLLTPLERNSSNNAGAATAEKYREDSAFSVPPVALSNRISGLGQHDLTEATGV